MKMFLDGRVQRATVNRSVPRGRAVRDLKVLMGTHAVSILLALTVRHRAPQQVWT